MQDFDLMTLEEWLLIGVERGYLVLRSDGSIALSTLRLLKDSGIEVSSTTPPLESPSAKSKER